ncbi:hypothetical protein [Clostridium sp. LCP25S3_F8]|uniref:hypothetical protein n=1 Tax=Clostridium sp. LCP25S3_F8 TaxID=3438751 RepID=UPI003F8F4AF2
MKELLITSLTAILTCSCIGTIKVSASEIKPNNNTSNQIVSNFKETKYQSIARVKAPSLTQFYITQYRDNIATYYKNGANIKRSNLSSLKFQTTQTGSGKISYLAIDGKELSLPSGYDYNKTYSETSGNIVTKWRTDVTIKNSVISKLSNGTHTVKVVCAGDKWDMNSRVITDTLTFNLVD